MTLKLEPKGLDVSRYLTWATPPGPPHPSQTQTRAWGGEGS